jgi:hypothetical protein
MDKNKCPKLKIPKYFWEKIYYNIINSLKYLKKNKIELIIGILLIKLNYKMNYVTIAFVADFILAMIGLYIYLQYLYYVLPLLNDVPTETYNTTKNNIIINYLEHINDTILLDNIHFTINSSYVYIQQ